MKNVHWEKQDNWHGNPELGYDCYMKHFKYCYYGPFIPVYVFGIEGEKVGNFVVSAGNNSDYSYSGYCPDCNTLEEVMNQIDAKDDLFK